MKYITFIAVIAVLLLDVIGAVPNSSVGGPLTLMLIFLLAMLAMGLYEAWSIRRGVLGWIVSLVASVAGGFVAVSIGGMVMEMLLVQLALGEPLATSQHPLRYIASAGMMLLTLLGSWIALQFVNRFR